MLFTSIGDTVILIFLPNNLSRRRMRSLAENFPCGSVGKEFTCNEGDLGSIPGLGRSPGEGNGYPFSDGKESACNAGDLSSATHSSILAWRISWMEKPGR